MFVHEVMTKSVVTVTPDTSLKEATTLLSAHSITAMPVVDERGELVGVLSEADVLLDSFLPDQRAHELPVRIRTDPMMASVGQVMSHHPLTVSAHADVAEAADLLASTAVKSLPVVDHDRVVGMLSRGDLIEVLARRDDRIEAEIDDLVRTAGYDWSVEVADGIVTLAGPGAGDRRLASVLVSTVPGVVGVRFPVRNAERGSRACST